MKYELRITYYAIAFIFFLLVPVFAQTIEEKELFGYINSERAREKLPPFIWDDDLYKVARLHSEDMTSTGQVSHTGSDNSQPHERIKAGGVYASKTAENIARDLNVISAHTSLMESFYHRENILDPEMTHAAAAIIHSKQYLYVTELFIREIPEVDLRIARGKLLELMNSYRQQQGLLPLSLSKSMCDIAQSHVQVQEKLNALSPPLLMGQMAHQMGGSIRVNVFTTNEIEKIPDEVHENLRGKSQMVGIGVKRIRGKLCASGCYLVTLIFGVPDSSGG
jgi:uncharacterized protein YkwD